MTGSVTGGLDAHVVARQGGFTLDVELTAAAGNVLAVLGPNGAGKSTLLRVLAGLQQLTAGHIRLDDTTVEEPSSRVRVPAQQRGSGLVPQASMLFPHLSVLDQVAFGPRHQGASRQDARAEAWDWLRRTNLEDLADRRPAQLSGGQARRVAIARALAARPRILLLDEPLAALDVRAVLELRSFLHQHLSHFPGVTVLVTHDALDALVLADQLVVLDGGNVEQSGEPRDVARHPRSAHVAALVGLNMVRGTADGNTVRVHGLADGVVVTSATANHGEVFASFVPTAVSLHVEEPRGSARNAWPGTVTGLTPHGDAVRVEVDGTVPVLADVTPQAVAELALAPGTPVWASVKAMEVQVYSA